MSNLLMHLAAIALTTVLVGPQQRAAPATQPTQAADFGFRFQFGLCSTNSFDTFKGEFIRDLGHDPRRSVTIPMSLSDAQMRAIYEGMARIRFFNYPSRFTGAPPGVIVAEFGPAMNYRLEVMNASVVHTVSWQDNTRPATEEARQLRELFSMMVGLIHEHPDVKRLPAVKGGCE